MMFNQNTTILSALFILTSVSLGSIPSLESLIKGQFVDNIPNYEVNGLIMNAHTTESFPFSMMYKSENTGLSLMVKTPMSESTLNLDSSFKVLDSSFKVNHQPLIDKLNYDKRLGKRNDLDEVVFAFYSKDSKTREKGVYYTKNTVDTFSIFPILQALSKQTPDAFSADFSVQHMAIKVPVIIHKVVTNNLLPFFDGYTLPNQLEDHIRSRNKTYIVYVLSVTGWQGFIYNHRHYYVFSNTPPYNYVGHWGGQDKTNLISWAINP